METETRHLKMFSAILILSMLFTIAVCFIAGRTDLAASSQYMYGSAVTRTFTAHDGTTQSCYVYEPAMAGSYKPLILFPGLGGMGNCVNNFSGYANKWAASGTVDNYVYIVPVYNASDASCNPITNNEFCTYVNTHPVSGGRCQSYFGDLLDAIESGSISSKINTESDITVCGYSLGGCTSLCAGCEFHDRVVNVGALSPSWMFYNDDPNYGWLNRNNVSSRLVFSSSPNAHLFMSAGHVGESEIVRYNDLVRYNTLFRAHNIIPAVKTFEDYGRHEFSFFMKEMYMFLYYIQYDVKCTLDQVNAAEAAVPTPIPGQETSSSSSSASASSSASGSASQSIPSSSSETSSMGSSSSSSEPSQESTTAETPGTTAGTEASSPESSASVTDSTPSVPETVPSSSEESVTDPAGTEGSGISAFVTRLYTIALRRSADPEGHAFWVRSITSGENTGADIARGFLYSNEFLDRDLSNEEFVRILYRTFFDREADDGGLESWTNALDGGADKKDIIEGFINSSEWSNVCLRFGIPSGGTGAPDIEVEPNSDTIAFATRLYTTCLCREADTPGMLNWASQLANQRDTGTGAARGFFFSDEFTRQNVSNEEYVNRLYRTFMGREADEEGFNAWVAQLNAGISREEVFNGFAGSPEFTRICALYGIIRG